MKTIKRILLILFGILSGFVGFISLVVSIRLMLAGTSDTDIFFTQILLIAFTFLMSEILLGFGIAASFYFSVASVANFAQRKGQRALNPLALIILAITYSRPEGLPLALRA